MKRLTHSMRFRLGVIACVMTLCLMLFSLTYFRHSFSGYLESSAADSIDALLTQTTETLDYSFSMLENTMTYFFSDQTLTDWFSDENAKTADAAGDLISNVQLEESLRHSLMLNSAWQNNLINSAFFIVDKRCFSFYSQGKLPVYELNKRCFAIYDQIQRDPTNQIRVYSPREGETFFFLSKRYPNDVTSELSLVLIVCVDEETLLGKYEKVLQYPDTIACIVDESGMIYSSADRASVGQTADDTTRQLMQADRFATVEIDGRGYCAMSREISTTGLRLCLGVPLDGLSRYAQSVTERYLLIMIASYAVMFAAILFISYRSTGFLKDINVSLSRMKQGDFSTRMPATYTTTELSELSSTFNEMAMRIDHLVNEVYEKQLAVNKADIKYLQSQINPHFLFNALAAIGTKAKLNGEESIYRMVHSVSTLLQAGMSVEGESMITVAEEIEYVMCYLYIQRERFGEKLQYQINVAEDGLKDALLPRLCIEPIVENAVIHGLEVKRERGCVTLEVVRDGADVLFIVTDDGVGFRKGQNPLKEKNGDGNVSIGLRNTDRRLQLIYGAQYGLWINEGIRQGAQVQVRIPYRKKADG